MSVKKHDDVDHSIMQWDCRNAPPAFVLFSSIMQSIRMILNNIDDVRGFTLTLTGLFNVLKGEHGRAVSTVFLNHGASYREEISKLSGVNPTTVRSIVNNLHLLGVVKPTEMLDRRGGKGNRTQIYALVVAGPEYTIKAQARFDHLQGIKTHGKLLTDHISENEDILRADDIQQEQEQADAERQSIIDEMQSDYLTRYGKDNLPVDLETLSRSLRVKGVSLKDRSDCVQTIAEYLEREGISTGIYRNGVLTQGYQPSQAIIKIRKERDN